MKLTKEQLQRIIKEELKEVRIAFGRKSDVGNPKDQGQGAPTLSRQEPGVYWVDDDNNVKSKRYNSEEEAYADGPPAGTFSVQMGQHPWSPRSIPVEVFEFHGTGYGTGYEKYDDARTMPKGPIGEG